MTAGSQFGFQPHPLPPLDIKKFHEHRQGVLNLHRERLFKPQIKAEEVKKTNIKSSK